jgi:hypothetical protein
MEFATTVADLPNAHAYLRALPHGLASYGDCLAAGPIVESLRCSGELDRLHDVAQCFPSVFTPNETEWVPEVQYVAVLLAVLDRAFDGDTARFLPWAIERIARRLAHLETPSLRGDNPARMVTDVPLLWAQHHRGTSMRIARSGTHRADIVLSHPTALFPPVILEYFARTFALALVRVDAAQPSVTIETTTVGPRAETLMHARWNAVDARA